MDIIEEKIKEQQNIPADEFENKTEEELKTLFDETFEQRTKGIYDLQFGDPSDVKKLLNILGDKAQWKGNEAISLVTVYNKIKEKIHKLEEKTITDVNGEEKKVFVLPLEAHAIESCNYFLGKHSSNGYHSAKDYLDVVIPVLRVVSEFQKMEGKLQRLSSKMEDLKHTKMMGDKVEVEPKSELIVE